MQNDFQTAQTLVADLSSHGRMHVIRILDQEGAIIASSVPDEVGIRLKRDSGQCRSCHSGSSAPANPTSGQIQVNDDGRPLTLTANPLDNQIACQTCHPDAGAALGVILAEHDLGPVREQVSALTYGIYTGTGILFLILAGVLWSGFNRLVSHPLDSLLSGGKHAPTKGPDQPGGTAGLEARPDEFGRLARKLALLESALRDQSGELDAQRRNFHALLTLSESIDVTLTAEKVLHFAIPRVQEVTGFTTVAMRLLEEDRKCFRLVAQNGMTSRMVDALHCIPVEIGFTGDVYKTHRAAYTSDLPGDARLESQAPVEGGFRSLISVPFLSGERLMGTMELAMKETHRWSEDEVRWLELMGRSIGNVLHHIETSGQLQSMAVMKERSRIAQEIHDGLAQLIGTLRMWADKAQLSLQRGDLEEVEEDLSKIEQAARDAYSSLREEILGLRETISPGMGILPVIREFLSRYQRQWGIETQLLIQQDQPEGLERTWISPAAEIQLLRIIQEGLTNVRRHAQAKRVTILIENGPADLRVQICDDGLGFDPTHISDEKLGLRIMRERAASLGGRIQVESNGGEGTRLIVELPKGGQPPYGPLWSPGMERTA
jgi:nitrate/nitrite-specific signal transduction histidine kinase